MDEYKYYCDKCEYGTNVKKCDDPSFIICQTYNW